MCSSDLEPADHDGGKYLINHIAEGDRPEVPRSCCLLRFGDEGDEGGIKVRPYLFELS